MSELIVRATDVVVRLRILDCWSLFEPMGLIVFTGLCKMNIEFVTFLEVKMDEVGSNRYDKITPDTTDEKQVFHEAS